MDEGPLATTMFTNKFKPALTAVLFVITMISCTVPAVCQTPQARPAPAVNENFAPEAKTEKKEKLNKILFALKDERDMFFAMQAVKKQTSINIEELKKTAVKITFLDFENYVKRNSRATQLAYIGNGIFKIEAYSFKINHETFNYASFIIKLSKAPIKREKEEKIDVASLENVSLDNKNALDYTGFRIYRDLLLQKLKF